MLTFHGSHELKSLYVSRVKDAISKNNLRYGNWGHNESNGWSGCAIGVLAHDNGNNVINKLSAEAGIPAPILSYIPCIFDTLPTQYRADFSLRFINSIPVGVEIDEEILDRIRNFSEEKTDEVISKGKTSTRNLDNHHRLIGEFIISTLSSLAPVVEEEYRLPVLDETLLAAV